MSSARLTAGTEPSVLSVIAEPLLEFLVGALTAGERHGVPAPVRVVASRKTAPGAA